MHTNIQTRDEILKMCDYDKERVINPNHLKSKVIFLSTKY